MINVLSPLLKDRCPVHTAKIITRWFNEHSDQVELLNWPSKGCDMNPIESVWGYMVISWEQEEERTRQQLHQHAMREWEMLRGKTDILYNMVSSMPRRLQEVIDREGHWSSY